MLRSAIECINVEKILASPLTHLCMHVQVFRKLITPNCIPTHLQEEVCAKQVLHDDEDWLRIDEEKLVIVGDVHTQPHRIGLSADVFEAWWKRDISHTFASRNGEESVCSITSSS